MIKECAVILAVMLVPGALSAQDLAAAARKEKERREKVRESGQETKRYGGDELQAGRPKGASDSQSPAAQNAPPRPGEKPVDVDDAKRELELETEGTTRKVKESVWRAKAKAARAALAAARKAHEQTSSLRPGPGMPPNQVDAMQGATKTALEAAEKAWEDLEDEARRASVPPGWLRE